jgi:FkbM family methyltransferase
MKISTLPARKTLLGKILRLPLDIFPKTTVVPILSGVLRGKKWIIGASIHSFWLGIYESDKQKIIPKYVKPGDIFYDIGANVGFYTLIASYLVKNEGHVYAFEPFLKNVEFLKKHVALNGLQNVTLFQLAIADHDGWVHFKEGDEGGTGKIAEDGNLEVPVVSLDSIIADKKLSPPNVLKIDVEGAEYQVLKGASALFRDHKPLIFLATHGDQIHKQCVDLLNNLGYQLETFPSADGGGEIIAHP